MWWGRGTRGVRRKQLLWGVGEGVVGDTKKDCQAQIVFSWPDSCCQSEKQME